MAKMQVFLYNQGEMKEIIKKIIQFKLKFIAKAIIRKHKPMIIGITGSLGKTSAKEAINVVLKDDFSIYAPEKSMNTETGLPLSVLREDIPQNIGSIFYWSGVLKRGIKQIFSKDYPKYLVLEYGVEKPGDMDYLLKITKPDMAVITGISESHLELLKNVDEVFLEKSRLVSGSDNAKVILNTDFVQLKDLSRTLQNEQLTYGFNCFLSKAENCVTATGLKNTLDGLRFEINFREKSYKISTKLFGEHTAYSLLAAFSAGVMLGMEPKKIIEKLKGYTAANGRMHIIDGINGSTIVDDSYNSSPLAAMKALEAVEKFKDKKRIILVLGSMNELGEYSEEAHKKIGIKSGEVADILITVGEMAEKWLAWSAKGRGLAQVYSFKDPFSAGEFLKDKVQKDDLILVKGSQNGVFTEEVTKVIMDKKYDPKEVLVRQSDDWMNRKQRLRNSK